MCRGARQSKCAGSGNCYSPGHGVPMNLHFNLRLTLLPEIQCCCNDGNDDWGSVF